MNLLEALFCFLAVFMFLPGLLLNYGHFLFPETILRLFRYGRANISNGNQSSSVLKTVEVPKRWFSHFYSYAVMLQFLVGISVMRLYFFGAKNSWLITTLDIIGSRNVSVSTTTTMIAVDLFLFHLCRRLYETLYVSIYSNTKMNILHYILGYIHYTGAIFSIVAHSPSLTAKLPEKIETTASDIGVVEICGIATFVIGNYLQHRAHVGLANLRKGKDKNESSGHKIPRGELFEYVSSPNYFAEILIYVALAGLFGFKNSSWNYCTMWVISNQVIAGIMNHLWYLKTFKDYPKQRKAIIPYVW
ncbi:Polyprenol reductase [Orchesella cincta]|uniref:Polyprenal reductase n=1 Tax=Orchesella cincta TaxID=48709 RepID=A0A1D2MT40_ORCCI|nr:Polyprenol reductase [Orchesella cincta]